MEKQREKEVTCYKIINNNLESSSQDHFEIENSWMGREATFPIHEEYKLQHARSEFTSDTNAFCNEVLDDLDASKTHDLHKFEQMEQFLKKSETVVGNLKRHRTVFAERSYKFLAESRRQLKILNKDSEIILEEFHEIQKELNDLLSSIKE